MEVSQFAQKSRVTGGAWPLHWTTFFTVVDDAYWSSKFGGGGSRQNRFFTFRFGWPVFLRVDACGIMAMQGLNMGTKPTHLFSCAGPVNDVSFSDWLNAYVFVTEYGDIRAGYCHQLLVNFADLHRKQRAVSRAFLFTVTIMYT